MIAARQSIGRPDRDAICITRYKPWAQCRDCSMTVDVAPVLSVENDDTIKLAYYRYVGYRLIRLAI